MYNDSMTLREYIDQLGIRDAAMLFGVRPVTIYKWRTGERRPRPDLAWHIERVTAGAVTMREIYKAQP